MIPQIAGRRQRGDPKCNLLTFQNNLETFQAQV